MHNWSTDEQQLARSDPRRYAVWKLEQLINYGLGGDKIDRAALRRHWDELEIDPSRKAFLELLLNEEQHSHA